MRGLESLAAARSAEQTAARAAGGFWSARGERSETSGNYQPDTVASRAPSAYDADEWRLKSAILMSAPPSENASVDALRHYVKNLTGHLCAHPDPKNETLPELRAIHDHLDRMLGEIELRTGRESAGWHPSGVVSSQGILRQSQAAGTNLCGMHSLNTVLHAYDKPLLSPEGFEHELASIYAARTQQHFHAVDDHSDGQSASVEDLSNIASERNIPTSYCVANRDAAVQQLALADAKALLILRAGHWVSLTPGRDGNWHETNSLQVDGPAQLFAGNCELAYAQYVADLQEKARPLPRNLLAFY